MTCVATNDTSQRRILSWEGPGEPPLFWVKKEEILEGRKSGRESKITHPTPHEIEKTPKLLMDL